MVSTSAAGPSLNAPLMRPSSPSGSVTKRSRGIDIVTAPSGVVRRISMVSDRWPAGASALGCTLGSVPPCSTTASRESEPTMR